MCVAFVEFLLFYVPGVHVFTCFLFGPLEKKGVGVVGFFVVRSLHSTKFTFCL